MSGSGTGTPIGSPAVLVVEDGTGKTDANSYLSVAEANTYHTTFTQSANWTAASLATKQAALIAATQYLDTEYGGRWRGVKGTSTQALAWPRANVVDEDGYTADWNKVPQRLKDACAELALRVVLGDDLLGTVTDPGEVVSESKALGPISKTVTYASAKPHHYQYPKIEALLRSLLVAAGRVYRG